MIAAGLRRDVGLTKCAGVADDARSPGTYSACCAPLTMIHRRQLLASTLVLAPATHGFSPAWANDSSAPTADEAATALADKVRRQIDQVFSDLSTLPTPMLTKPMVSVRFEPFLIAVDLRGGGQAPELVLPTWDQLIPPYRRVFQRWMQLANTGLTAREFFEETFQWALVAHELAHVLHFNHRRTAPRLGFFGEEESANRFMVAWCHAQPEQRERLDRLGRTWAALHARLPNPVPTGQVARTWFESNYERLGQDPDAYGWFQFRWMSAAWEERHQLTLAGTVAALTQRSAP